MSEVQALVPEQATDAPAPEVETSTTEPGTAETVAQTEEEQQLAKLTEDKRRGEQAKSRIQKRFNEYAQQVREKDAVIRQMSEAIAATQGRPAPQTQYRQPPNRDEYKSYEEYIEARADYRAEKAAEAHFGAMIQQASQVQQASNNQQQSYEIAQTYAKSIEDFAAKTPDFATTVDRDDIILPDHVAEAVRRLPDAPQILYAIGKNPSLVNEITKHRDPIAQLAALGRIAAAASTPAQISKAPKPGTPVGTRSGSSKDPSHMTRDEYYDHLVKGRKK